MKFSLVSLFLLFVITSTGTQSSQTPAMHAAPTGTMPETGKWITLQKTDVK